LSIEVPVGTQPLGAALASGSKIAKEEKKGRA